MKKTIIISIAALVCVLSFSACESFIDIDKYIYEKTTLDSIFVSKERTLQYINGTAEFLPNETILYSTGSYSPSGVATDEAFSAWVDGNNRGMYLMVDQITPMNTQTYNPWPNMYKGIRKATIILNRLNENHELTDMERRDYMGRAYFLRAYFYYTLVRLYGPVPIVPETELASDTPAEEASFERSSYDDCIEYICQNFEMAAQYLPQDRTQAFIYLPTRGAALSFAARMRLYHASPLYNGNTYYSNWKRSDGTHFISQTEDKTRWGVAAAAFKRVIEMNKYQLYTFAKIESDKGDGTLPLPPTVSDAAFPYGAGDIDPYKSYKSIFDGSILPDHNSELIYFYPRSNQDDWIYYPNIIRNSVNGFSVTQDMIDQFRMADGRQFSEATEEEKSWEAVGSGKTFSGDYLLDAQRARMHDNREPRFYATIGFNYCVWPGTSYTGTEGWTNLVVNYANNGNAKPTTQYTVDYNRTGYTSRKYVNQEDILNGGRRTAKTQPIMRYAEILLGYVEAMNEMTGSYTDPATGITVDRSIDEMMFYFNQVRYRAGLPGITQAQAADYETMKALIKQEWRVEFCFEDHRYYDLRRWKEAPEAYNKPVTGLDVSRDWQERQQFYTVRVWNTELCMRRVFNNKMYFFCIDQNVLDKNSKLVQNPGW